MPETPWSEVVCPNCHCLVEIDECDGLVDSLTCLKCKHEWEMGCSFL